jgi:glucose-6-phosphate isomerase
VLSEVGILPAYLMGINTKKLRSRILESLKGKQKNFLKESTIKLAGILNSKKYNNIVFLNYSSKLGKFLLWCQQLMAESLGKNNKGFMPIISNVPKDHHSLLQLYLDGPKDKLFYIFSYEEKSKKKIKSVKLNKNSNDILNNKSLSDIKIAQQNALIKAFKIKNIPFREFQIKKGEEEVIGELFAYFMFETILIGKLVAINPFNQPAVEQVKIFTNKYLN